MRVCSIPGCPEIFPRSEGSRCTTHRKQADRNRGTAKERGYTGAGHRAFRTAVLQRDPICQCGTAESTVADHHPRSRRELIEAGLNPNDPTYGRGLCAPCHSRATANNPGQRGGWNQRD